MNTTEEQTTRTPYGHPNYKHYFDQRQGQNEHTQRRDDVRRGRTTNQNTKQQTRRPIPQSDQIASLKIDWDGQHQRRCDSSSREFITRITSFHQLPQRIQRC